ARLLYGRASRHTSHHRGGSHSTRWGFSGVIRSWIADRSLSLGHERLAAGAHRSGRHKRECNHARLGALVDPVVDSSSLHEHIAGLEVDGRAIEVHVDFAGHNDSIVD